MNKLLDYALLLCPKEFRRSHGPEIREFVESGEMHVLSACADVIRSGIALRCETMAGDLRFALRTLVKTPLFTFIVILTIALGVSVNTAVFGVVNAVLLRPLPFVAPEQMVFLSGPGDVSNTIGIPEFATYSRENTSLSDVAGYEWVVPTLTGFGNAQTINAERATSNFFDVAKAQPELGRFFTAADARPGVSNMVISDSFWRRYLNGDPNAVGRTLQLDGKPWTIVGVARPDFQTPDYRSNLESTGRFHWDIWECRPQSDFTPSAHGTIYGVARLRPGFTVAQAQADLSRVAAQLRLAHPTTDKNEAVLVTALTEQFLGGVRPLLFALLGAVALVLFIACANVANLLLVRAAARSREYAVRSALGASRSRLIAQIMSELAVLVSAAGVIGVLLAGLELRVLVALHPGFIPRVSGINIDGHVLLFVVAIVVLATVLSGLVPAFSATKRDAGTALKTAGRGGDASSTKLLRSALAIAEIALAFAVLVGCGLLVRSLAELSRIDVGFKSHQVYTAQIITGTRLSDAALRGYVARALEQVRAIPGIDKAGVAFSVPNTAGGYAGGSFTIVGAPASAGDPPKSFFDPATEGYFEAMGIPLIAGRAFTPQDRASSQPVAIISEAIAKHYFGDANPIGRQIDAPDFDPAGAKVARTIVGIVGDVRTAGPARQIRPFIYLPFDQFPIPAFILVMHTNGATQNLAKSVEDTLARVDRLQAVASFDSLDEELASYTASQRTSAVLLGILAAVALLLALAGIYAIIAYTVEQRTHEFGVRLAIGAQPGDILRNVLGGAVRLTSVGIAMGLVLAALGANLLSSLLFGISALDPLTFAIVVVVLLASVMLASSLPAWRATEVDPAITLRYE